MAGSISSSCSRMMNAMKIVLTAQSSTTWPHVISPHAPEVPPSTSTRAAIWLKDESGTTSAATSSVSGMHHRRMRTCAVAAGPSGSKLRCFANSPHSM
eukprot:6410380-Prymnesium_polylepis.1